MQNKEIFGTRESGRTSVRSHPNLAHRILVVENDPYLRQLIAEALFGHGYEVNTARDGADAWQELQAAHYNLLITNYDLPEITGVGLIKRLRAARQSLPVVMVAGRLPVQELAKNLSLQPAATLLEPFDVDELLATVDEVLYAAVIPLKPDVAQAAAISQLLRDSSKPTNGFGHWGINE